MKKILFLFLIANAFGQNTGDWSTDYAEDATPPATAVFTWQYNDGTLGQFHSEASDLMAYFTSAIEGTSILSTGEEGGTKFLREDGDGTCSWQTPSYGISNLVEDTTPELGGDLDAGGNDIVDIGTLNFDAAETVTLATDVATITQTNVIIAAQDGTTDDLATITNASVAAGDIVIIRPDTGDTITVKDGTGNIDLGVGSDAVLDDVDEYLVLQYDGAEYDLIAASPNVQTIDLTDYVTSDDFADDDWGTYFTVSSGNVLIDNDVIDSQHYVAASIDQEHLALEVRTESETFTLFEPDQLQAVSDFAPLKHFPAEDYPNGVTMVSIHVHTSAAVSADYNFEEWTDLTGAAAATIEAISLSTASTGEDDGAFDDGDIAADSYVCVDLDDTDYAFVVITLTWTHDNS